MSYRDKEAFLAEFGAVYEQSPWVADGVFTDMEPGGVTRDAEDSPTLSADILAARFESVFMNAPAERQLKVLRAHPELGCARAESGLLTADSRQEQSAAGLDQCSVSEFNMFREMNDKYTDKYGFPFIIAVKGRNRREILEVFAERLNNTEETEFQTALRQVCQIARFRIGGILGD